MSQFSPLFSALNRDDNLLDRSAVNFSLFGVSAVPYYPVPKSVGRSAVGMRRYRQRLKQNPVLYRKYMEKQKIYNSRYQAKIKERLKEEQQKNK